MSKVALNYLDHIRNNESLVPIDKLSQKDFIF